MNLYFKDIITSLSTILVVMMMAYICITIKNRKDIKHWGKRVIILGMIGLVVCICVVMRDQYYLSVQASMDSSLQEGLFGIKSLQSTLCSLLGGLIGMCLMMTIFMKRHRQYLFYGLSVLVTLKVTIIELSRIGGL